MNPAGKGTKVAGVYRLTVLPGQTTTIRVRLYKSGLHPGIQPAILFSPQQFDVLMTQRIAEADEFYSEVKQDLQRS